MIFQQIVPNSAGPGQCSRGVEGRRKVGYVGFMSRSNSTTNGGLQMTRCAAAGNWNNVTNKFSMPVGVGLLLLMLGASVAMSQTPRQEALSAGRFLVAGEHLRDPNFGRSVVLLLNYGERGARGLIINRRSQVKLSTLFPRVSGLHQRPDTVYIGGPVARNQLLVLLRSDSPPGRADHIIDDLYVSSSRQTLIEALNRPGSSVPVHVYAGYAGWAPGQLDHEVARGDWHILPGDAEVVFSKTPNKVWRELLEKGAVQWL